MGGWRMMKRGKLIRKYDRQSHIYAQKPMMHVLASWRRRLLRDARGEVLEVAVGTGVNFPYYTDKVTQLTGVDFSPQMLVYAEKTAQSLAMPVRLQQSDVEQLTKPSQSFDTVVSSLSLCGYDKPISVLNQFNKWCRQDGRILLLEHGISENKCLAGLQYLIDPWHNRFIGCHQKRDILALLSISDLQVEAVERHIFGAFYLIWARPAYE